MLFRNIEQMLVEGVEIVEDLCFGGEIWRFGFYKYNYVLFDKNKN